MIREILTFVWPQRKEKKKTKVTKTKKENQKEKGKWRRETKETNFLISSFPFSSYIPLQIDDPNTALTSKTILTWDASKH